MVKDLFAPDYDIKRIILTIGAITGVNIQRTCKPSRSKPLSPTILPS